MLVKSKFVTFDYPLFVVTFVSLQDYLKAKVTFLLNRYKTLLHVARPVSTRG